MKICQNGIVCEGTLEDIKSDLRILSEELGMRDDGIPSTHVELLALDCAILHPCNNLAAIKELRNRTPLGLKEAKDAIEAADLRIKQAGAVLFSKGYL